MRVFSILNRMIWLTAGLTEKIIHMLESHGLKYRENLEGQSYDGVSVMSGKHACVQVQIKDVAKHAFDIHCSAHCLNLVQVDTKQSLRLTDFSHCRKGFMC